MFYSLRTFFSNYVLLFLLLLSVTAYPVCDSYYTERAGPPDVCIYKQPVVDSRTVLSVSAPVVKADIFILDVEEVAASQYLPINLAAQFPNLEYIYAKACSIRGLAPTTLLGLTKIKRIDLKNNQIQTLTADMFQGLTTLLRLDMSKSNFD